MDFLGLVNLTVLAKVLELIARTRNVELSLRDIPLDDSKTFELLSRGDTVGVFQLEGAGMTRYIKELKPSSLGDVAAMIALYRPGPMDHIGTFIDAKHGRSEPDYPHPAFRDILEETYGVIVYQDQVLLIAQKFAGYSLGEADTVRKAMGKKIPEIMAQEREKFIHGALEQGYSQELAERVFALVEPFAGYAFNKAHSVSYGLISYWTAYLKANYPAEYMVSLLNSYTGNTEKIASAVDECRRLNIRVLGPDINGGEAEFSMEDLDGGGASIRYGMAAVKNVGAGAVLPILEARAKNGPFSSIEQMCRAADMSGLNRKALESLIKVGAFAPFGDREALLSVVERILALAQSEARLRDSNQTSMFGLFGELVPTPLAQIDTPETKTPESQQRAWEVELIGRPPSPGNPFGALAFDGDSETVVFRGDLGQDMAGKRVVLAGQVSSVTRRYTRDQRPFAIVAVDLMDGSVEVFVWEELLGGTSGLWEEGRLVRIVGTVRVRGDQISISCTDADEYHIPDTSESSGESSGKGPGEDSGGDSVRSGGGALSEKKPGHDDDAVGHGLSYGSYPSANGPQLASENDGAATDAGVVSAAQSTTRYLNLRIQETETPQDDQDLLEDLSRLLLEYGGQDDVSLEIATQGRIISMEWPLVRVDASPELERRLQELLGPRGRANIETKMAREVAGP